MSYDYEQLLSTGEIFREINHRRSGRADRPVAYDTVRNYLSRRFQAAARLGGVKGWDPSIVGTLDDLILPPPDEISEFGTPVWADLW